jgi:malonyl CoA-acyl carrier protein transacylase
MLPEQSISELREIIDEPVFGYGEDWWANHVRPLLAELDRLQGLEPALLQREFLADGVISRTKAQLSGLAEDLRSTMDVLVGYHSLRPTDPEKVKMAVATMDKVQQALEVLAESGDV